MGNNSQKTLKTNSDFSFNNDDYNNNESRCLASQKMQLLDPNINLTLLRALRLISRLDEGSALLPSTPMTGMYMYSADLQHSLCSSYTSTDHC